MFARQIYQPFRRVELKLLDKSDEKHSRLTQLPSSKIVLERLRDKRAAGWEKGMMVG